MNNTIRILTYNIHSALGRDLKRDYARIGRFLAAWKIDIALLQEVETRPAKARKQAADALTELAAGHFHEIVPGPTRVQPDQGWFGNAILSRFPILGHEVVDISVKGREPRNIMDAQVRTDHGILRVMNLHKGLSRVERYSQLEKLEILLARQPEMPLVVGGDVNEWFFAADMLKRLNGSLFGCRTAPTFPVAMPIFHLDRIWCRPARLTMRCRRLKTPETKIYSDHYPVLSELSF